MDESKSGMTRRRPRASMTPRLETLEGRRLMAAGLSQVGIKEVSKQGFTELDLTGTNKGDVITINDNGSNTPGNVSVTLGTGTTYTSQGAVSVIKLQGGAGADKVTYNLTGTLTSPQSVLLNLGGGDNHFMANIAGAINSAKGLDLEVFGGSGNDTMVVNQTGPTLAGAFVPYFGGAGGNNTLTYNGTGNIASGASVTPEFAYANGKNKVTADYSGRIDGNYIYNLSSSGGGGTNDIQYNVNVGAGSTGTVGISPSSPAAIEAGKGNGTIKFSVAVDPTATAKVNAVVVAGSGKEIILHTPNVLLLGKSPKIHDVVLP